MSTDALTPATAELLLSFLPPTSAAAARGLLTRYEAARAEFTAAEAAVRAELAGLFGPPAATPARPARVARLKATPHLDPAANDLTPGGRVRKAALLGMTALRTYDTLVALGAVDYTVTKADVLTLVRPPTVTDASAENNRYLAELTMALKALVAAGLVVDSDGRFRYVPVKRVPYANLYLPALVVTRLYRLGRPATLDELVELARTSDGVRGVKPTSSKCLYMIHSITSRFVTGEGPYGPWSLVPGVLGADPPVEHLPDEPEVPPQTHPE